MIGTKTKAYLQLCRPPNLPTAAADNMAGMAIAGAFITQEAFNPRYLFLIVASVALYAGGVVLNDVFDIDVDTRERPHRPIPSGSVPLKEARLFGYGLLALGVAAASLVQLIALITAMGLSTAIVFYNAGAKHSRFFGPFTMGLCRGLNLLLGLTVLGSGAYGYYAAIPLVFIFAVTTISQGEVYGNNRSSLLISGVLYALVIILTGYCNQLQTDPNILSWVLLLVFALMVLFPLAQAYKNNTPQNIQKAVKFGVLSLIVLDAAMAAAHTSWFVALLILALLPLSLWLAKIFAVT
ncbi:MAG: UbiA-like protein EboC [Bacteroidota bacterium]